MSKKNDALSRKIQFLANRIRCPNCFSDNRNVYFVVDDDDVKLKFSLKKGKKMSFPVFFCGGKKLILNKPVEVVEAQSLVMVCFYCGQMRKTRLTNIQALKYD